MQINARVAADPLGQARFVLRLPNDWNGKLVVAGASGTRSEFNGDCAWSDYVLQQGYAYASQNKGALNLYFAATAAPTRCLAALIRPRRVYVHFYDVDPGQPFTQWTQYMIADGEIRAKA